MTRLALAVIVLLAGSTMINTQPIPGCADIDNLEATFNFDHSKLEDLLLCFCQTKANAKVGINCLYGSSLDDLAKAIALATKANRTVDQILMNHVEFNSTGLSAGIFHRMGAPLVEITIGMCAQSEPLHIHPDAFIGLEKTLRNLSIFECALSEFPSAVSKMQKLERLSFANNKITAVNRDMLSTHKNLVSLNLAGNFLANVDEGTFSQLTTLDTLIIGEHNFINESFMREFSRMPNLKILDLSKADGVESIANGAFEKLKKLEQLVLTGCSLQNISNGSFRGLSALQQLDLRVNLIEQIANNSFADLKKLKRLSLAGNYLQTLNASIFAGLNDLEELDVGWNELEQLAADTFKSVKKLRVLDIRHNQKLDKIDENAFRGLDQLRILNMSEIAMKKLSSRVLSPLGKLEALDLNNSNLTSFSSDVLKTQKTSLKRLYLGGAQLTTLNNATIASLTSLEELDLSKNPWRCDDQLAPVIEAIFEKYDHAAKESHDFQLLNANDTQCDRPYTLKGRVITDIDDPAMLLVKYDVLTDTTTIAPKTTKMTTTVEMETTTPESFTIPVVIGSQAPETKSHAPEPEDESRPKYDINSLVSHGPDGNRSNSSATGTLIAAVAALTAISVIVIAAVFVYLKRKRLHGEATETELKDSPMKTPQEKVKCDLRHGKGDEIATRR